jgi:hypothetical protein
MSAEGVYGPGRYSRHIRLAPPAVIAHPMAGIVRLEISTGMGLQGAVEAADFSARVIPKFTSTPERDPRAPQNLLPIGALERALRHAPAIRMDQAHVNRVSASSST